MADQGSDNGASQAPTPVAVDPKDIPVKINGAQSKDAKNAGPGTPQEGEQKLSGKELKLKKQAEKQARRAKDKADKEIVPSSSVAASNGVRQAGKPEGASGTDASKGSGSQARGQQDPKTTRKRAPSQSQGQRPLPLRRRPSQNAVKEPRKVNNEVGLFGHLYNQPRRYNIEGVSKEVHPAVLALGFQMSNYVICGSNARCVAMLLAFKKVHSYQ